MARKTVLVSRYLRRRDRRGKGRDGSDHVPRRPQGRARARRHRRRGREDAAAARSRAAAAGRSRRPSSARSVSARAKPRSFHLFRSAGAVGSRGLPWADGLWRSSSGRRKPGRSPVCSSGYLGELERDPVLIVPNRGGRRPDRTRPAAAHRRAARRLDRHVRRRLPRARARRRPMLRPVTSDAQRALVARRGARGDAAERPRPLGALRRLRRRAPGQRSRELESGLLEPEQLEGDLGAALRRLPRGARPARTLGPRPAAAPRGRAAAVGARRLGRPAGLRLRLRGPDGRRVGAARGARRAGPR